MSNKLSRLSPRMLYSRKRMWSCTGKAKSCVMCENDIKLIHVIHLIVIWATLSGSTAKVPRNSADALVRILWITHFNTLLFRFQYITTFWKTIVLFKTLNFRQGNTWLQCWLFSIFLDMLTTVVLCVCMYACNMPCVYYSCERDKAILLLSSSVIRSRSRSR